ncbi:MAG: chromate transporter [Oscillospiraceae bacterium]|nr:chromate transporter [Oscillospiraceae bacterium]
MAFNFFNYIIVMLLAGVGSFGGGLGAVNIIKDFAINWNWITDENEFLRIAGISQYNGYSQGMMMATYLGVKTQLGIIGGILGVVAFLLPSVLIVIIILKIGEKLYKNSAFKHSVKYMNLLAVGLMCVIAWNYLLTVFGIDPIMYVAVAGIACFLNIYFRVNPAFIILGGAVIGAIWRA